MAGDPLELAASLNTSHTQTTTQNQQGAVISTGITFSPNYQSASPVDSPQAVTPSLLGYLSQFSTVTILVGAGLIGLFVLGFIAILKRA